ncbi:MAG: amino acid ABC transporter permease [Ruminococcaceae bacterium]|nr:amino acid ABC transporter permease [Oscillospiraceae bacterium]
MTFNVVTQELLGGFAENCKLFAMTLLFAIPLGLIITFGSMSKWAPLSFLRRFTPAVRVETERKNKVQLSIAAVAAFRPISFITRIFIWIIRGTPLLLQLLVVFYVPGLIFDYPMTNRMLAALVAFVINYACYFSEIYRGGIEAISKGQYEAGQVLGMTKTQVFFKIVLMQVIKRIVPPMGNEIITLVKDTSLARIIAVAEILKAAERFSARGVIWPLFYTGAFFLVFCGGLTILFSYIEKKLDYYKG